jgi:hypothetical protein
MPYDDLDLACIHILDYDFIFCLNQARVLSLSNAYSCVHTIGTLTTRQRYERITLFLHVSWTILSKKKNISGL